jgi:hypothetical protein
LCADRIALRTLLSHMGRPNVRITSLRALEAAIMQLQ